MPSLLAVLMCRGFMYPLLLLLLLLQLLLMLRVLSAVFRCQCFAACRL